MDYTVHGILQARILERVAFPFSRGSSQPQVSNPGLPYCRQILYQLSHKESPRILELVAYLFASASSWSRNQTWVSCIAGRFFTNWAIRDSQMKEQDKTPENEVETGNLPEKEFRIMIVNMIYDLQKRKKDWDNARNVYQRPTRTKEQRWIIH